MTTREDWKKRIEQHRRSGLSAAAWCKQHGIRENQFHYWRRAVETPEVAPDAGRFVRVSGVEAVELFVGEKLRLKVPAGFDSTELKRLLEVLGC